MHSFEESTQINCNLIFYAKLFKNQAFNQHIRGSIDVGSLNENHDKTNFITGETLLFK